MAEKVVTISFDQQGRAFIAANALKQAVEIIATGAGMIVQLDQEAIQGIGVEKDMTIKAVTIDKKNLSPALQKKIGNGAVYEIDIAAGDESITIGKGKVIIKLPFQLAQGKTISQLQVYALDAQDTATLIKDAEYESDEQVVVLQNGQPGRYALGYKQTLSFTDVNPDHWAAQSIYNLAEQEIVQGKTKEQFFPDDTITRAEFVSMLAGIAEAKVTGLTTTAFEDVDVQAWYTPYITWANNTGLIKGFAGRFEPNTPITRQDMATLLFQYAQDVAKVTLPYHKAAIVFRDKAEISPYAQEAVGAMQQAGVIVGNKQGEFQPFAAATRAEAATMTASFWEIIHTSKDEVS